MDVGAVVAMTLVGGLAAWTGLPMLLAPFGATAVLLFGQAESPLAQPVNLGLHRRQAELEPRRHRLGSPLIVASGHDDTKAQGMQRLQRARRAGLAQLGLFEIPVLKLENIACGQGTVAAQALGTQQIAALFGHQSLQPGEEARALEPAREAERDAGDTCAVAARPHRLVAVSGRAIGRLAQAIAEGRFNKSLIPVFKADGTPALDHEEFPARRPRPKAWRR